MRIFPRRGLSPTIREILMLRAERDEAIRALTKSRTECARLRAMLDDATSLDLHGGKR